MPVFAVAAAVVAVTVAVEVGTTLAVIAAVGATVGAIGAVTNNKALMIAGGVIGAIGGIGALASSAGVIGNLGSVWEAGSLSGLVGEGAGAASSAAASMPSGIEAQYNAAMAGTFTEAAPVTPFGLDAAGNPDIFSVVAGNTSEFTAAGDAATSGTFAADASAPNVTPVAANDTGVTGGVPNTSMPNMPAVDGTTGTVEQGDAAGSINAVAAAATTPTSTTDSTLTGGQGVGGSSAPVVPSEYGAGGGQLFSAAAGQYVGIVARGLTQPAGDGSHGMMTSAASADSGHDEAAAEFPACCPVRAVHLNGRLHGAKIMVEVGEPDFDFGRMKDGLPNLPQLFRAASALRRNHRRAVRVVYVNDRGQGRMRDRPDADKRRLREGWARAGARADVFHAFSDASQGVRKAPGETAHQVGRFYNAVYPNNIRAVRKDKLKPCRAGANIAAQFNRLSVFAKGVPCNAAGRVDVDYTRVCRIGPVADLPLSSEGGRIRNGLVGAQATRLWPPAGRKVSASSQPYTIPLPRRNCRVSILLKTKTASTSAERRLRLRHPCPTASECHDRSAINKKIHFLVADIISNYTK
jgi:hypothetical protein